MSGKITTFHKTVRGHLHLLKDRPCEDYSASFSDEDGRYHIIAVADGHGDCACMRSNYGSQAAVEIALDCLKSFAESSLSRDTQEFLNDLSAPRSSRQMIKQLTDTLISRWYQQIRGHLENQPLTDEELNSAEKYTEDYRAGKRLEHVYGTTLIAALYLPEYLILLQQGDGRCDIFYADGHVDQPIPWDDRCFENVTTSMCDEDVAASIRHRIIMLKNQPVVACYIGSDGVEDSYGDMDGTHTFYRKLSCELLNRRQPDFEKYLDDLLPEFSSSGSGDDVSVAGIVDVEAIKPLLPLFQSMSHKYELLEAKRHYDEKLNSMTRKHGILKKRVDEARTAWEQKDRLFKEMSQRNLLSENTAVALPFDERVCTDAWEQYQTAERDFSEYDQKYQELLKAQQNIDSQIKAMCSL